MAHTLEPVPQVGSHTDDAVCWLGHRNCKSEDSNEVMLEMTRGELFIVVFVTVAIVSAPWWGRAGAVLGRILAERAIRKTPTGRQ